ncbi:MAG: hypothetical protein AAGF12_00630 [Myxococcota bacterium]
MPHSLPNDAIEDPHGEHSSGSSFRRRIWSEFVSYPKLSERGVLGPLAERQIELCAAVTPDRLADVGGLVDACRAEGVVLYLWPMLGDGDGRWARGDNHGAYSAFVDELLGQLDPAVLPQGLALDFEPSIEDLRRLVRGDLRTATRGLFRRGANVDFAPLARAVHARGLRTLAAVPPVVVLDQNVRGWQRVLDTPVEDLPCEAMSPMAYSSLFEGYSRGFLRREDARCLLAWAASRTRKKFGERAALSLGVVGPGALGDEQAYRDPSELADDVGLARAAGVDDLALFSLDGVLVREPVESWLDAFATTPPARRSPDLSGRARMVAMATAGSSYAFRAFGLLPKV